MAKKNKRQYRDGFGRFTTKEKFRAIKNIQKEGVYKKSKGKVQKEKIDFKKATELLTRKKLKVTDTGRVILQNFENDIEYYFIKNPDLKIKGRIGGNDSWYYYIQQSALDFIYKNVKKAWRDLKQKYKVDRLDSPPPTMKYTRESFAGNETPIRLIVDFNDVEYQLDFIYLEGKFTEKSEKENELFAEGFDSDDDFDFDESIREAPEKHETKIKTKKRSATVHKQVRRTGVRKRKQVRNIKNIYRDKKGRFAKKPKRKK